MSDNHINQLLLAAIHADPKGNNDELIAALSISIDNVRDLLEPAGKEKVRHVVRNVADVLGVQRPDDNKLNVYSVLLCHYCSTALSQGWRDLVANHSFKLLPLPAEFVRHVRPVHERTAGQLGSLIFYHDKLTEKG